MAKELKPCGTVAAYERGCRCESCTDAKRRATYAVMAKLHTLSVPDEMHGKPGTYNNWGCRCDACKAAHQVQLKRNRRQRLASPVPDFVVHGSINAFVNYGCRCEVCTSENNERQRARRLLRRRSEPPQDKHGTRTCYIEWGCRCDACRAAQRQYDRLRKERSRGNRTP